MPEHTASAPAVAVPREAPPPPAPSALDSVLDAIRPWLRDRRIYWIGGAVLIVGALALGWNWLLAVGLLPILLAVLPCVAMCAIGLCAMNQGEKSCGGKRAGDGAANAARLASERKHDLS